MPPPPNAPLTGARDMWRNASPSGAVGDFIAVFKQAGSARWPIAALAALTTVGIFSMMAGESWRKPPAKPQITWITSFAPGRSEAEIIASNVANQKRKDADAAELARREADVRGIYMKLGRMSGMDVDKIAAQGDAERAAAEAKRKAEAAAAQKAAQQADLAGRR